MDIADVFGASLYGQDAGGLPEEAVLASMGCGNPLAVADLHEGERVLDLGARAPLREGPCRDPGFEGPLCCNTGVCGPDPDQALADFTADVDWLARQGVEVRRANLAQDPAAFAESAIARAFVRKAGAGGLPLVVADDVTVVADR